MCAPTRLPSPDVPNKQRTGGHACPPVFLFHRLCIRSVLLGGAGVRDELRADGTLSAISEKYFGKDITAVPEETGAEAKAGD